MRESLNKWCKWYKWYKWHKGYRLFRKKYSLDQSSIMKGLSRHGQQPEMMILSCCDSRVDPAVILQCDPGDLFVIRNIANIVPPYEKDNLTRRGVHGTSAAIEYGIRFLKVKHFIILGHSQCGGVRALREKNEGTDFILPWLSCIQTTQKAKSLDDEAQLALHSSYQNCMSFPWIAERVAKKELELHRWFFNIEEGQLHQYDPVENAFRELTEHHL